ncbi:M16 family metallopeptidase [Paludisphaera mucosa]|uniref:Pitrilysin family protein n=1 Tax=Paludisphaera mucosa TaxID=3030827 RepID=A0ABT6FBP1_9BACT|nr:pitrilysin family protein [Paludisphaera mucosa]MDG3005002.1 pitrilysin family protein [Paludisphaera mucosa]
MRITSMRLALPTLAAALGSIVALAGAPAAVAKGPLEQVASVEGITEYHLPNGMRVLLFPDASKPKVTVALTVFVGSRHEGYGETGMAHLLEHMVFKGTPDHPNIPGVFKERGAQFNGTTSDDRTNYFETLTATDDNLEFAVRLEADRMVNSPIKAEDLATEFSVVRNEFERGENSPIGVLFQRISSAAYDWHNYGKSTIGNRTDIERVPVDNLRAFYKKYYQPDNAMLVVAGKFDEAKAKDYIVKYFGALAKPDRKLPQTYTEEPPQDGERVVTLRRVGDVGVVGMAYHVPSGPQADYPALEVLADVLTSQPSGRLYKALVETRKAASVSGGSSPSHDPGLFTVIARVNTKDRAELEKVRDVIYAELKKVADEGVTAEEVGRAVRRYAKNFEMESSDPNSIALELSEWAAQGDWRLYFLARDRMEKVTPDDVKRVAAAYFEPSNRTVGYFIPAEKPERTPIPANPDVNALVGGYKGREAKSTGESFDVRPEAIEARVQRPSEIEGVKVALLPKKTRGESVNLVVTLRYGDAENLKGLTTAADFLPGLMVRGGTKNLTKQQLQDELDKNFARLSPRGSGVGTVAFALETKRANLPAALEILRQVLREPLLPAEEFEVQKTGRLAALESSRTEPTTLASNRLQRLMSSYPADDVRYTPTPEEGIARVKEASNDQVKKLYQEYLGANVGELAVVGDFEPSEVLPIVKKMLEGWKASKPYARIERPYQEGLKTAIETIETPDKENAMYLAGSVFPLKDDAADYPALSVGNFILGGGSISSRIADRLRGKGGLSYSAASMFNASSLDPRATVMVMAIYNPRNLAKVEAGVKEEVARIVKEGVTAEELSKAKDGWLRRQEIGRTEDGSLASTLASNLFLGRTLQFDADVESKVKDLDAAAVDAALKKYVDFSKFSVVTAGDFKNKGAQPEEKK